MGSCVAKDNAASERRTDDSETTMAIGTQSITSRAETSHLLKADAVIVHSMAHAPPHSAIIPSGGSDTRSNRTQPMRRGSSSHNSTPLLSSHPYSQATVVSSQNQKLHSKHPLSPPEGTWSASNPFVPPTTADSNEQRGGSSSIIAEVHDDGPPLAPMPHDESNVGTAPTVVVTGANSNRMTGPVSSSSDARVTLLVDADEKEPLPPQLVLSASGNERRFAVPTSEVPSTSSARRLAAGNGPADTPMGMGMELYLDGDDPNTARIAASFRRSTMTSNSGIGVVELQAFGSGSTFAVQPQGNSGTAGTLSSRHQAQSSVSHVSVLSGFSGAGHSHIKALDALFLEGVLTKGGVALDSRSGLNPRMAYIQQQAARQQVMATLPISSVLPVDGSAQQHLQRPTSPSQVTAVDLTDTLPSAPQLRLGAGATAEQPMFAGGIQGGVFRGTYAEDSRTLDGADIYYYQEASALHDDDISTTQQTVTQRGPPQELGTSTNVEVIRGAVPMFYLDS